MSFESELLIARLRGRGSRLIIPTLLLMLAAFLLGLLGERFEEPWQIYAVYGVCAALAFFGFVVPIIRYATTFTDVTNARVVLRSGIFGQNFDSISLADIERVELLAGGIISLVMKDEEVTLRGLPKPKFVASEISRLVERRKG